MYIAVEVAAVEVIGSASRLVASSNARRSPERERPAVPSVALVKLDVWWSLIKPQRRVVLLTWRRDV